MKFSKLLKVSASVAAAVACFSANAASNGVVVKINAAKSVLAANDDVNVNVTITNTSATEQKVLKWYTPFGEVEESLFDIRRDGVKVPYLGAHYKRPAPTAADYVVLKPGKSYTQKVELSSMYDMSVTGNYTMRYRAASFALFHGNANRSAGQGELDAIQSDRLALFINGRASTSLKGETTRASNEAGLTFTKCTASQSAEITSAISAASTMANGSMSYLSGASNGPRFTTWFGPASASSIANIKTHFTAIKDAIDTKPINVDCGCKKTYYAYVYPNQPYNIYVCKAFWTAPMSGTDSKGGTLIHELSHFNAVVGTDDWVYGQSGAKSLAISDPAKAMDNADSHEYFAENTPALN